MKKCFFAVLAGAVLGNLFACSEFLDAKPDVSVSTPETLADLRALLDDEDKINRHAPGLLEMGTDDYFLDYSVFSSRPAFDQAIYLWDAAPFFLPTNTGQQWTNSYRAITTANVVLEALDRIEEANPALRDILKGEALFIRGYAFYFLAQLYSAPYEVNGSNDGLGIPLRLTSDFNVKSTRATVKETYDRIIDDLQQAVVLLPEHTDYKTRPNKTAAYAALARIYLSMEEYELADEMADAALTRQAALLDFNQLDFSLNYPFTPFHEETLYFAFCTNGSQLLLNTRANIPDELYHAYAEDDLRKSAYYFDKGNGYIGFRGSYTGSNSTYFAGLATDELYLIRAECRARAGRIAEAISALNQLLETRWKTGTYEPYTATTESGALAIIVGERRKELAFRGVRWSDLRRLNKDERFAKTLMREVDDGSTKQVYTLPPNDPKYIYLLPQDVILATGMPQNR
ncbi:RagB/SusD family nutrient uptake outer membrane protein [Parapedobacter tibetensis]|uniref:RagB/SusD family nutrient uptake outer membrane protein n=1 Tax=Parapedobacter tibetensis TaxID=2972951 RepID=UPI00214D41FA|nr:RagB/SusD family nutrient uptake outer membrane protein [Parapedobacter tibetensis]